MKELLRFKRPGRVQFKSKSSVVSDVMIANVTDAVSVYYVSFSRNDYFDTFRK